MVLDPSMVYVRRYTVYERIRQDNNILPEIYSKIFYDTLMAKKNLKNNFY
jgi:hypothetical protein